MFNPKEAELEGSIHHKLKDKDKPKVKPTNKSKLQAALLTTCIALVGSGAILAKKLQQPEQTYVEDPILSSRLAEIRKLVKTKCTQTTPHQIKCDDTFISNSITPLDNIIAIESRKQRTIFTWRTGNQYINIETDKKNRYSCIVQDKDLICKKDDQTSLHTDFMHPTEILKNSK